MQNRLLEDILLLITTFMSSGSESCTENAATYRKRPEQFPKT